MQKKSTVSKTCLAPYKGATPIPGIFHGASPRCFFYTTACQLIQPVVGYTARNTAFELGLPSGIGKLIPLLLKQTLLDAGAVSFLIQHALD